MYRAKFIEISNLGKHNIVIETEIPFVPQIGAEVMVFVDGEKHFINVQSVEYVFNKTNKFDRFNIYLGRY